MVKLLRNAALFLIFFSLSLQFAAAKRSSWFRTGLEAPKSLGAQRVSHLHFYFHDTVSGQNQTAVPVTRAAATANASATQFGLIRMMDDPLTEGQHRAQCSVTPSFWCKCHWPSTGIIHTSTRLHLARTGQPVLGQPFRLLPL
ncbi:hypothetical protein EJ110_NYTH09786 [Nymphaea thermarum]|nr:hypothetical protein EJ110_NYTH09786 [Nymphaea thermarum]